MEREERSLVTLAFLLAEANDHIKDNESTPASIDDYHTNQHVQDEVDNGTRVESAPASIYDTGCGDTDSNFSPVSINDTVFGDTDEEFTQAFPTEIPNIFASDFSRWLDIPNTGKSTLFQMFDDYRKNQHEQQCEVDNGTHDMHALLQSQPFTPDECQRIFNSAVWHRQMECASTKLQIVAQNQFGDYGYAVDPDGVIDATDLDPTAVWTIREPDESLSSLGGEIRTYDETEYLLNAKAAKVLPVNKSSNGSMTAISVEIGNQEYFVLTGDNKKYLMNCGGALEPGESYRAAAVREILEELGIHVKKSKLQTVAKWTYTYGNTLIGPSTWTSMNVGFHVKLKRDNVQHLVPTDHVWGDINVFRPQNLSETELVVFLLKDGLQKAPSRIQGKLFNAHHRRVLHLLADKPLTSDCDTSNLSSFTWCKVAKRPKQK